MYSNFYVDGSLCESGGSIDLPGFEGMNLAGEREREDPGLGQGGTRNPRVGGMAKLEL